MQFVIDTHTRKDVLVPALERLVADLKDESRVGGIVSSLDGTITYSVRDEDRAKELGR